MSKENDDFISFLEEKFDEYIHENRRLREHRHFGEFRHLLDKSVDVYERVNLVTKAQNSSIIDSVGYIFSHHYLTETVIKIDSHYSNTHSYLRDLGYLDLIDDHFDIISENITVDMLPREDLEIMRMLGSNNPERTAKAAIFSLKSMSKTRRQKEMYNVKRTIKEGAERIHSMRSEYEESRRKDGDKLSMKKSDPPEPPKPPRKWWKGCGQIAQGCALTMGNIGLAFDMLGFPVAPETKTWGSVVSVTTGVGLMMSGVGDLRGE